ncbi:hypothetical protein, partial [Mailhella massiliensis]|uniref:hypothetical protein n=1 Tax=Mailhella massiliensis TaxID=1903261 RepID=UPI0023556F4E
KVFDSENRSSQIELKALFPNSLFTCQRTVPLTRGGVALCNFSFPLSTTFFKVFFQRSAFGVSSFEPLCLSAFSSYARFTPFCQTLFSHFSGNFSPILRILPIKLAIGNKNSSFFLFRRTAFFPGKQKNSLIPPF